MTSIYFVRHGPSEWNVTDQICGATDIPLTAQGHAQARETGEKIKELGIRADLILCSPLKRAADTAKEISGVTGIPVKVEPRLVEQNFGIWEGTSPRDSKAFRAAKLNFICSYGTGESMFRVAQRIYDLLDELKAEIRSAEAGGTAPVYILVAHNGIARFVKSYFQDMTNEEFASFGVGNCEVCRFDF